MPLVSIAGPGSRYYSSEEPGGGSDLEFDMERLVTDDSGVTFSSTGGFSHAWTSDETGSYLRLTWATSGTKGANVAFPDGVREVYFEYEIRRHTLECTKQMKIRHEDIGGSAYSNATFGGTNGAYSGNQYVIYYDDNATGTNDQICRIRLNEANNQDRTPFPTLEVSQAARDTYTQSTDGTWEKIAWWHKFNDPATPNGEFALWKWLDGPSGEPTLLMWAHTLYNCIDSGGDMGSLGIGEYTQSDANFYEDYRNLRVLFSRPTGRGID